MNQPRRIRMCRLTGQHGTSLFEMLVTMALTGILMAVAVAGLKGNVLDLSKNTQTLFADLRKIRLDAITRGAHYQVTIDPVTRSWTTQRLQDDNGDGIWVANASYPPITKTLTSDIALTNSLGGSVIEFDTRGMVYEDYPNRTLLPAVGTLTLTDTRGPGGKKVIEVWPSGQMGVV